MKIELGPEKPFTIERAEETKRKIKEVIALIDSGGVLGKDFRNKLEELKNSLLELLKHHVIRREIITKIEILENLLIQYENFLNLQPKKKEEKRRLENLQEQINSLLEELKTGLSHVLEVLERVFLDNLKNFILNLHLAESALEDPEVWKFVPEDSPEKDILLYIYQTIERVLREFPKYEDIETKESLKFSNFDNFLDYLIERIIEALKALEGVEGIKNKEKKLEISLTLYARLLELILLKNRGVDKR
jgi:hypothetical protein